MSVSYTTQYAIVGAGIAGVAAIEALRSVDADGAMLLINAEVVPPYCRPLIIEELTGERKGDEIGLRDDAWYESHGVQLVSGDPACQLDPAEKVLTLESGRTVRFEKLLVATGSRPVIPSIPFLDEAPAATLYRRSDVAKLKPLCKGGGKAVVLGMGLIGLQAVKALTSMGLSVTAFELADRVLPLILDREAAGLAQRRIEENGVNVRVESSVAKVAKSQEGWVATTGAGDQVRFDVVVVAAGMRPESSLLEETGVDIEGGVKVGADMATSLPGVYAAGDVARYPNRIEGKDEVHAHWVNAYRQGRIAGLNMAGGEAAEYNPVFLNSLDVFGLPVITMGASRLDDFHGAEVYDFRSEKRAAYSRLAVKGGKVVAATFVNDVDRAGMFQHLVRNRVDAGAAAGALFEGKLEGVQFYQRLHADAVRGEVHWPATMDLIASFRKDMKKTRWGGSAG